MKYHRFLVLEDSTWLKVRILSIRPYPCFSIYDLSKWHREIYECIYLFITMNCYHWRVYKISENMSSVLRQSKCLIQVVQIEIVSASNFSRCFQMIVTKNLRSQLITNRDSIKKLIFYYLKAHNKEVYIIIDILVLCVFCFIILT